MADHGGVRYGTPTARWVLAATVLGSGIAFLDGTVVNVALPAIGDDMGASVTDMQWVVDAYLVTLGALLLLGGSLGDRFGRRRVFVAGLVAFTSASTLCGLAPTTAMLIAARAVQGAGAALLVPGSLSIIAASFDREDRATAIGAWSGLAGVTSAIGPFVGGWLIDEVSWRLIFLINVPLAAAAITIAVRHVPETRSAEPRPIDIPGAALCTAALACISYAAIEHRGAAAIAAAIVGVVALVAFVTVERAGSHPMLPLGLFRAAQFTGSNLTTFAVYGGLSAAFFLVVVRLQVSLGYSALGAGSALVPFTALMLMLSPRAGRLGQRVGARIPMTVGPLVAALGVVLLSRLSPGDAYGSGVLPGVVLFGTGMALTVAPLTAAVLGSVTDDLAGVASGVNNAAARVAGLVGIAAIPAAAGIDASRSIGPALDSGYATALVISAAAIAAGGIVAAITVRTTSAVRPTFHPSTLQGCQDPAVATAATPHA